MNNNFICRSFELYINMMCAHRDDFETNSNKVHEFMMHYATMI